LQAAQLLTFDGNGASGAGEILHPACAHRGSSAPKSSAQRAHK
jgi:hypothetical protein